MQGLQQNGVKMKSNVLATGYSQDLLDQPIAKTHQAQRRDVQRPTGRSSSAVRRSSSSSADLKKYAGHHRRARLRHVHRLHHLRHGHHRASRAAGKNPTRQSFVDGIRKPGGQYDGAGLLCQPIDLSYETFGKIASDRCTWFVSVKDGKFMVLNGGKPVTGKLVGDPDAHRAVREQHRCG